MNSHVYKLSISTLSIAAIVVTSGGLAAQAETIQTVPENTPIQIYDSGVSPVLESSLDSNISPTIDVTESKPAESTLTESAPTETTVIETAVDETVVAPPIPGTPETSATELQLETAPSQPETATTPETEEATVAQVITPGRATRGVPSYIGIGGNIGFGGRTALGRGNFVITSKVGLTNNFSARPGIVVGRRPTILLPVTVDFPILNPLGDRVAIAPFVGGGMAISTGGGSSVRAVAMGGVDIPITNQFTATASANAAFFRRPEIGVILGVGYNF